MKLDFPRQGLLGFPSLLRLLQRIVPQHRRHRMLFSLRGLIAAHGHPEINPNISQSSGPIITIPALMVTLLRINKKGERIPGKDYREGVHWLSQSLPL
ncbi:hypothetical protein [Candidatus Nitrospira neomarina]|uniref:Uncharacterized protein n=1 Tax=Candidatus Nitrospira neomarina TaxID=3020899 RepID=A0AA96JZL0_9BACT|nr:hypothetical protein [Candidatus Nitrospira neomarina]WNM61246.1 hypothetical protein PQG83_16010 [Candidatus Nitrospira neomarina]